MSRPLTSRVGTGRPAGLYALLAGVLITTVVMGVDVGGGRAAIPEALRDAGASVTSPLLTTAAGAFPDAPDQRIHLVEAQADLALAKDEVRRLEGSAAIAQSPHLEALRDTDHQLVLARVVALGAVGPAGPERLTIDIGSDDGIALDQSVVTGAGLLGRTVRVGRHTSDVLVIGAADLVVGARAVDSGRLGTVSAPDASSPQRRQVGQLEFAAISFGELFPGEALVSVGSPDDAPFVAGLPIGHVTEPDPDSGGIGMTAAVDPAVTVSGVDVVAVVVPGGR